ncbi:MAG: phosphoribosylanthranilate isomerase [Nitrospirae bacterium]|nr:phosphoribosylanthranilate isomerase [Nitrospirota bacterium]MBI3351804.1 phosphoribosylanthranilate isomerase [Nitrospirota bacterium]
MVRVKICGMTSLADAQTAVLYGADALGFIFYQKSPRGVSVQKVKEIIQALPPFVLTVGVFVNETAETIRETVRQCGLSLVQLHGDESPEFCGKLDLRIIKAIRVSRLEDLKRIEEYDVQGILLDAYHPDFYGGTGRTMDWKVLQGIGKEKPIILSGGLTPENVRQAIQTVSPYGLDVCTGVEEKPGKKDPEKIRLFIKKAKEKE